MNLIDRNPLSSRKLLHTKWTAAAPVNREKHFLVTRLVQPEPSYAPVEFVELEAVHSGRRSVLPWRELQDRSRWLQGWVRARAIPRT
jgi:tryptophan-rich hypothetical protein